MKFNFRLQRLLHLREAAEKQQANSLGAAAELESIRQEVSARSAEQLDQVQEQLSQPGEGSIPAGLYHAFGLTVEAASARAQEDQATLRAAQAELEAEQARYHEARMARRTVERLRERQESEWQAQANRAEQKELDEIASQRGEKGGEHR